MALIDPTAEVGTLGEGLHQEALPDFILIRTDEVDEGERLRPVDPVWAKALGQMMARDGQDTPIQVCRLPGRDRWTLVAGAHRLAGAVDSGIEHLKAEVVGADRDARRLREVRENLWRSDLTPFDRAAFIAEAVAIYKRRAGIDPARDGRAGSIAARWQKALKEEASDTTAIIAGVYGFTAKVAGDLNLSMRTVEYDLMLYRRLPASIVERLRGARHPILSNASQLRALAKLDEDRQALIVDTLVGKVANGRTITSVAQAMTLSGSVAARAPDPEAKRLSAFIGAFSRMGVAEKKGALAQLAGMLPAGFRLVEGDERPASTAFPAEHERYRDEALEAIDAVRDVISGLEEDEAIPGDRGYPLYDAGRHLALTRMTIVSNGFELHAPEEITPAEQAADLRDTIRVIVEYLDAGTDPDFLIRELIGEDDETSWSQGEGDDESGLTMDGVTAAAFGDTAALLGAWVRGAEALAAELESAA